MADNIVIKKEPSNEADFTSHLAMSADETCSDVMNNDETRDEIRDQKPIVISPMDEEKCLGGKSNIQESNPSQLICKTIKTEPLDYHTSSDFCGSMSTKEAAVNDSMQVKGNFLELAD